MKRNFKNYCIVLIGLILLAAGFYLIKAIEEPQGILKGLPYIFIGIGSGTFGSGIGTLITKRTYKYHPDIEKQMEIDKNDERNITINNRGKAKAYDLMKYVYGALMLTFALMNIDITALLLLVFAYLLVIFSGIYFTIKYDKEM